MVSALIPVVSSLGLSPGRDIVLCSQARHLTLTVPLCTRSILLGIIKLLGKPNKLRRWTVFEIAL